MEAVRHDAQGRRGADTFSNFLVVAGIVLLFASLIPGLDLLSWVALIVLAYSLFRSYSKNIAARDRENATFEPHRGEAAQAAVADAQEVDESQNHALLQVQGLRPGAVGAARQGHAARGVPEVQNRDEAEVVKASPWISQLSSASCSPSPTTCRRYCTIR